MRWCLLFIAGLLLIGCDVVNSFTNQSDEPVCQPDGSLFTDRFGDENVCGWLLFDEGGVSAEITENALRISAGNTGEVTWTNPQQSFDDVSIEVTATQLSGPNNNAYGLICRYQDEENFYIFLVSGDGYYAIGRYDGGSSRITYLTGESPYFYQESEAIFRGSAANRLRAECDGDRLAFFVNDELVDEVEDDTFVDGDIGLAASTFEPSTAVIEFDNLVVTQP